MARMALRTIVVGLSINGAALAQTPGEAPDTLPYRDGEPIPAGYELRSRPRLGLVIAGAVVGGAAYGFAVMGAVDDRFENKEGFLLVPVLGPWLTIGAGGADDGSCRPEATECLPRDNRTKRFVLGLDGVLQAAGAIMLTTGIVFPRQRLERSETSVSLLPAAWGEGRYGAVLVGAF